MDYVEYSFSEGSKVPLDDINLPQEVRDYVDNLCRTTNVIYEMYPQELIEKGIIMATWCGFDLNDDNIEFQSFNLFEKMRFDVFTQGVTFYNKVDDGTPGYMVYQYNADDTVIIIKV